MPGLSGKDSHRYRAYVSYSHRDEKWARWLHKGLESYRIPKRLVGRRTPAGVVPRRIAPVFRDREELPSATDLGAVVNAALAASDNLIVICSPHAAASRWVNQEILTFKRLGQASRIFCLIVDGEPGEDECFPGALRHELGEGGKLTDVLTEPIAADARRGKDGKTNARLKLIAGLIGVGFDELHQRELHRRHYRMTAVTAAAIAIAVMTAFMAYRAVVAEQEARLHREQAESLVTFMLGDLRERLQPIGRLDVLDAVDEKAMEYFEGLGDDLAPATRATRGVAMRQIGEVHIYQGRLDDALDAFRRAHEDAEWLVNRNPQNDDASYELAQAHFWIGYVHWQQGDLDSALRRFQSYRDIAETGAARDADDDRWLRELGYAHTNLAVLLQDQGDLDASLEQFQGGQDISRRLVERDPGDPRNAFDLSEATSWVGTAREAVGDLAGALDEFRDEVAIKQTLVALDPNNTPWQRGLALAHRRVGEILEVRGDVQGALASYRKGREISLQLTRLDTSNTSWRQDLARVTAAEGRAMLALGDLQQALQNFEAARSSAEALIAEDSTKVTWQRDLADFLIRIGDVHLSTGDEIEAKVVAAAAREQLEKLVADHPDDRRALRLLGEAHLLAGCAYQSNDEMAAASAWRRAMVALEKIPNRDNDYRTLAIRAQVLMHLGLEMEADPIIERLVAMGYAEPAFVDLCSLRGLSTRLVR